MESAGASLPCDSSTIKRNNNKQSLLGAWASLSVRTHALSGTIYKLSGTIYNYLWNYI